MTAAGSARAAGSRVRSLAIECFAGGLTAAAHLVIERAHSARGGYACLANVHVLVTAQHDPQLQDALDGAWGVFPDGAPVAWLQRRSGIRGAERVGGPDLMALVCTQGVGANLRHFLLGSTDDVLKQLQRNLEGAHPGISIVGSYSPTRHEIEHDACGLIDRVSMCTPHIVWCALGAPRQELWMARNARALTPSLVVGVGAAFDFIGGAKARAPIWAQRTGFEWLHRLATEPKRLGSRYLRTNSEFVVRVVLELVGSRARQMRLPPIVSSLLSVRPQRRRSALEMPRPVHSALRRESRMDHRSVVCPDDPNGESERATHPLDEVGRRKQR